MPSQFWSAQWSREVHGKADYGNVTTDMLIRSYSELGAFPHNYLVGTQRCKSHPRYIDSLVARSDGRPSNYGGPSLRARKSGVSALTFNNKANYLAAGTRAGCLTIYDFDSLYHHSHAQDEENQTKQVLHKSDSNMNEINAIKWNPVDENKIAYVSRNLLNLQMLDITGQQKVEFPRIAVTEDYDKGLSDVAFASSNGSLIVASDCEYPTIAIWDTRLERLPIRQLELDVSEAKTGLTHAKATCVQYSEAGNNQYLVAGGTHGFMCVWDVRSGDVNPLHQWNLCDFMRAKNLIKPEDGHRVTSIDSLGFNPSNHRQLAFHVNNGWSGVFDLHDTSISHIHKPLVVPGVSEGCLDPFCIRRSSWLSETSIYMAPSRNANGIFLLDFNSSNSSPHHVDSVRGKEGGKEGNPPRLIPLSKRIITLAAHPMYDAIVAGTEDTSLLVISQNHKLVAGGKTANVEGGNLNEGGNVEGGNLNEGGNVEGGNLNDEDEELTDEDEDEDEDGDEDEEMADEDGDEDEDED